MLDCPSNQQNAEHEKLQNIQRLCTTRTDRQPDQDGSYFSKFRQLLIFNVHVNKMKVIV